MISLLFLGKFHIISDAGRVQDMRQSSSVGSDQVLVWEQHGRCFYMLIVLFWLNISTKKENGVIRRRIGGRYLVHMCVTNWLINWAAPPEGNNELCDYVDARLEDGWWCSTWGNAHHLSFCQRIKQEEVRRGFSLQFHLFDSQPGSPSEAGEVGGRLGFPFLAPFFGKLVLESCSLSFSASHLRLLSWLGKTQTDSISLSLRVIFTRMMIVTKEMVVFQLVSTETECHEMFARGAAGDDWCGAERRLLNRTGLHWSLQANPALTLLAKTFPRAVSGISLPWTCPGDCDDDSVDEDQDGQRMVMGISHSGDGFGFPWLGGKPHRPPGGPATLTVYNTNISNQEILLWRTSHRPRMMFC